jgi:hypothetical protein
MGSDLLAILVFILNLIFFIWFGTTLNSINRHLGNIADHVERQTKLQASIANASEPENKTDPEEFECDKCGVGYSGRRDGLSIVRISSVRSQGQRFSALSG